MTLTPLRRRLRRGVLGGGERGVGKNRYNAGGTKISWSKVHKKKGELSDKRKRTVIREEEDSQSKAFTRQQCHSPKESSMV